MGAARKYGAVGYTYKNHIKITSSGNCKVAHIMMRRARTCVVLSLALLTITSGAAIARPVIQFAGFAYSGAFKNIPNAYPYTDAVNVKTKNGERLLDRALNQRIRKG